MKWRRPVKTTAVEDRVRFVWMWVGGKSLRAIARETGASVPTVYRWVHRWQQEGNVNTKTRGHKPSVVTLASTQTGDRLNYSVTAHTTAPQFPRSKMDSHPMLHCCYKLKIVPTYFVDHTGSEIHQYLTPYTDIIKLIAKIQSQ
ncbi:putative Glutamate receptor-like 82 [Homarus americanus]|uniref:Putative Glutamate receptor-like 82 n=1 Tax=Homarus americanus TaxID=6706 RepID=A0A8J5K1Y1_HOMAM|nr:putative Glutamate receptor-like 82 [Homarus americanus]